MRNVDDLKIIEQLRKDARSSISDLVKTTGLSRSTIFRRMKWINRAIVKKYTTIIEFGDFGYALRVMFFLRSKDKALMSFLLSSINVNSVFEVSSRFSSKRFDKGQEKQGYSIIADAFFRNMAEFSEFDEKIASFCPDRKTHFLVEEIKTEGA